ncbi:MAG: alpha/beta fold hydrolase [Nitrospira sp.]|nr:alpha/beta fold hydrolase [Nitrospira sp.]
MLSALLAWSITAPTAAADLQPCRLRGVPHEARCGSVSRALDPAQPGGVKIDVHFAVLPALARNKLPDPVFFVAGGPGQSAIELAGPLAAQFGRLNNRRDLVFVDQRGTGRSAPLRCDDDAESLRPLADRFDQATQLAQLAACRARLMRLPWGDLRFYSTTVAMADLDAVRAALGATQIDLVGASYGTRAVIEYMRLFPRSVRRAVLDGVAPADMVLPASFSTDNQAALDALFAWCEGDAACRARHPQLRRQWAALLHGLPREVVVDHPFTGAPQHLTLSRPTLLSLVRAPLYAPILASALPQAIADAVQGRWAPLVGLASSLGGGGATLYTGMHFSVVCAEDVARLSAAARLDAPGAQFGDAFAQWYERACADWPRAAVPAAFYAAPVAPAATWLLSGAADPVTPPRHAARIAAALGPKARHIVVPHAGHGVMALPCLRDAVRRFIEAADDAAALQVPADCAAALPRPPAFVPLATLTSEAPR